jgi:hypothetical protein
LIKTTDDQDDWEDFGEEELFEEEIKVDTNNLIHSEDEIKLEAEAQDPFVIPPESPTSPQVIKNLIEPNQPEPGDEPKW